MPRKATTATTPVKAAMPLSAICPPRVSRKYAAIARPAARWRIVVPASTDITQRCTWVMPADDGRGGGLSGSIRCRRRTGGWVTGCSVLVGGEVFVVGARPGRPRQLLGGAYDDQPVAACQLGDH